MTKPLPPLTNKMRLELRRTQSASTSKYTIGGRLKEGKRAPRPITLRRIGERSTP